MPQGLTKDFLYSSSKGLGNTPGTHLAGNLVDIIHGDIAIVLHWKTRLSQHVTILSNQHLGGRKWINNKQLRINSAWLQWVLWSFLIYQLWIIWFVSHVIGLQESLSLITSYKKNLQIVNESLYYCSNSLMMIYTLRTSRIVHLMNCTQVFQDDQCPTLPCYGTKIILTKKFWNIFHFCVLPSSLKPEL